MKLKNFVPNVFLIKYIIHIKYGFVIIRVRRGGLIKPN